MEGNLGSVGKYDAEFKDGQLVLSVTEQDAYGSTKVERSINAKVVLDAIAKLGSIEASIVSVLEAALIPAAPVAPSA